jgi:hypothetical protein
MRFQLSRQWPLGSLDSLDHRRRSAPTMPDPSIEAVARTHRNCPGRRRALSPRRSGLAAPRFGGPRPIPPGELSLQGLAWWRTRLTRQLDDLVTPIKSHPANEKFAKFLERHVDEVFTFLCRSPKRPAAAVTNCCRPPNYLGELAIRPAVINRKVWGGNRTDRGAAAQATSFQWAE